MSITKSELSKKNPYYISRHRYYELRHWVQQYPEWKRAVEQFDGYYGKEPRLYNDSKVHSISNPTQHDVEQRDWYLSRMNLVVECIQSAFDDLSPEYEAPCKWHWAILDAIIKGESYDILRVKHDVPFGKDYYYNRYRKFFWLLSMARE